MLDINNKLMIARYMRDFINNPAHATSVLPVNTGIGDINIETQISEYNKMLLGRNNIAANSSESNPVVKDYDASLTGVRAVIMSAPSTRSSPPFPHRCATRRARGARPANR